MKPKIFLEEGAYALLDPASLVAHPRNPTINLQASNPVAFEQLKKSVADGWHRAVIVRKGTKKIIGGHQRVEAAIALGLESVPVQYLKCTEKEAIAIMLRDNGPYGHTNSLPILTELVTDPDYLGDGSIDIDSLGFNSGFFEDLAAFVPEPRPEETASPTGELCPTCERPITSKNRGR